jgi:hypothetical protein
MSTIVVQHYAEIDEPPVGLWWVEDGVLRSVYAPGHQAYLAMGRQVMSQKLPEVEWVEYFHALEQRNPMIHGWETIDVFVSPPEWLKRVRSPLKNAS